jgi:hypothetical protein
MREDEPNKPDMHEVLPVRQAVPNRHNRRALIADTLNREERLMIQEMKLDVVKALIKPKNMTKAQLRRRRKKDASR